MDIDFKGLFEANEDKEFSIGKHDFKIIDAKLNVKVYLPICVDQINPNIVNKIWRYLINGK